MPLRRNNLRGRRHEPYRSGVGHAFINSDEIVHNAAGNRVSHLLWESQAPLVNGRVEADFANGWTLRAGGSVAFSGSSRTRDYDWFGPYFVSFHAVGDTTMHSISTGAVGPTAVKAAGMTLRAMSVSGGFRMKF